MAKLYYFYMDAKLIDESTLLRAYESQNEFEGNLRKIVSHLERDPKLSATNTSFLRRMNKPKIKYSKKMEEKGLDSSIEKYRDLMLKLTRKIVGNKREVYKKYECPFLIRLRNKSVFVKSRDVATSRERYRCGYEMNVQNLTSPIKSTRYEPLSESEDRVQVGFLMPLRASQVQVANLLKWKASSSLNSRPFSFSDRSANYT